MKEKIKTFFKNCVHEKIYRAYWITTCIALIIFILATLFENNAWLDGMNLSKYMESCFQTHQNGGNSLGYVLYYSIFYLIIIPTYLVPTLYFLTRENENKWYAFVIFLSIIFLFFTNAYLSEMLMYKDGGSINQTYMTCCICVATVLTATAGIKIGMHNKDSN